MVSRAAKRSRERRRTAAPVPAAKPSLFALPAPVAWSLVAGAVILVVGVALRLRNPSAINPADELYHALRVIYSVQHFPDVLTFDPGRGIRGAFCPWPPLYDSTLALICLGLGRTSEAEILSTLEWIPPIAFGLFAAAITCVFSRRWNLLAGLAGGAYLVSAPTLITQSSRGDIDHHFVEAMLVVAMALAAMSLLNGVMTRIWVRVAFLGAVLLAALLVQAALIVAAGLLFFALYGLSRSRESLAAGAAAFFLAAVGVLIYRATAPAEYPDSPWFLGFHHAALMVAAALALALRAWALQRNTDPWAAWLFPIIVATFGLAAVPGMVEAVAQGSAFFTGATWLRTIHEFQPYFRSLPLATGFWFLIPVPIMAVLAVKDPQLRLPIVLSIGFGLLFLTAIRFNSLFFPLLGISAAVTIGLLAQARRWRLVLAFCALLLIPNLVALPEAIRAQRFDPEYFAPFHEAARVLRNRDGRILGPWETGHLIHFESRRPVVIDNFGFMGIGEEFERGITIPLSRSEDELASYCRRTGVRTILLKNPALWMIDSVEIAGLPGDCYVQNVETAARFTSLARSTFWWRAYYSRDGGEIRHFRKIWEYPARLPLPERYAGSPLQIWEFKESRQQSAVSSQ